MAKRDVPLPQSETENATADANSKANEKIHCDAMDEFDAIAVPQREMRSEMLQDRRFTTVTGAMWEGAWWNEEDDLLPRPEIDKITKPMEKIIEDYRENRLDVTFLPAESADQDTADTLNDAFRADAHISNAALAWDNAFNEMVKGGMGAWRLTTDLSDAYDPNNDHQRINPGVLIPDADQCVYFYGGTNPDGSDAKSAFIISNMLRREFNATWGEENADPFPVPNWKWAWDWYQPDVVQVAEYFKVVDEPDEVLIFTQEQSGEEQRYFKSEIEGGVASDLKKQGWKQTSRPWKRRRVRKYILNGSRVLKDCGFIAGDCIPIVVVYARVDWVDNLMRVRGYVRKKKDPQRGLNSAVSRLVEIDSLAPFEVPIFDPEQLDDVLMAEWAEANIKRTPFRRARALRDENGNIAQAGPVGKVDPPQVPPTLGAILQFNVQMLSDDDEDTDVPANTPAEAIELNQNRIDSRSVIFMDGMAAGLSRTGQIYRGMAREIYYEPGREIDTRDADGKMGKAELSELSVDPITGVYKTRNDLTRGTFHVEASVQESSATKRQKSFRMGMELSQAFIAAQSPQDAVAMLYDAVDNMDGLDEDTRDYIRQKALAVGVKKPTPEEAQQIAQAEQSKAAQPNPQDMALQAEIQKRSADAQKALAGAQQLQAKARLEDAQAQALESAPKAPTALQPAPTNPAMQAVSDLADAHAKVATANLNNTKADHLKQMMTHQRIKTGAEIANDQHQQAMDRAGHALDVRKQEHAESQPSAPASGE